MLNDIRKMNMIAFFSILLLIVTQNGIMGQNDVCSDNTGCNCPDQGNCHGICDTSASPKTCKCNIGYTGDTCTGIQKIYDILYIF